MIDDDPEKMFLGIVLSDEKAAANLKKFPKKQWFRDPKLGQISEAINRSNSIDPLTVARLASVNVSDIIELQAQAPISTNPNAYANEIYHAYKGRLIAAIGIKWNGQKIYDDNFFQTVESDIAKIQQISGGIDDCVFTEEVLDDWIADKEKRIAGLIKPIKSGFPGLDEIFAGGFHRQDLITVAGRPGSGKSGFLKSAYCNMVKQNPDTKAAIFSIEMSPNEYMDRMCSEIARINGIKLRQGTTLDENEMDRVMEFSRMFHCFKFSFNRAQECTVHDIARLARAAKFKFNGLDIIFVDHMHIIKSHNNSLKEVDRLAEISIGLKRLAQVLDVPVVVAAQCNRAQDKDGGRMPIMSDIRGSGAIEQDSNCIVFVHRAGLTDMAVDSSLTDVVIRKNRHGPSPIRRKFRFEQEYTAFTELAI